MQNDDPYLFKAIRAENEAEIYESNDYMQNKIQNDYIKKTLWFADKDKYSAKFVRMYYALSTTKTIVLALGLVLILLIDLMFLDFDNYHIRGIYEDEVIVAYISAALFFFVIGLVLIITKILIPRNWTEIIIQWGIIVLCVFGLTLLYLMIPADDNFLSDGFHYVDGQVQYTFFKILPFLPRASYIRDLPFLDFTGTYIGFTYLLGLVLMVIVSKLYRYKEVVIAFAIIIIYGILLSFGVAL